MKSLIKTVLLLLAVGMMHTSIVLAHETDALDTIVRVRQIDSEEKKAYQSYQSTGIC